MIFKSEEEKSSNNQNRINRHVLALIDSIRCWLLFYKENYNCQYKVLKFLERIHFLLWLLYLYKRWRTIEKYGPTQKLK